MLLKKVLPDWLMIKNFRRVLQLLISLMEKHKIPERKSFQFANAFIVKSDVPSKKDERTSAKIFYVRDPERFIFNYSWKSIFSGVKKS
ncbi:MAG: hypothetical protein IPI10_10575 [Bacteroidetes bacterium]|nr:hypothetical protein [Bacteroidota bacterium]